MNMQSETKWRVTSIQENKRAERKTKSKKRNENILKTGAKLIKLMLGFWASSQRLGKYTNLLATYKVAQKRN